MYRKHKISQEQVGDCRDSPYALYTSYIAVKCIQLYIILE